MSDNFADAEQITLPFSEPNLPLGTGTLELGEPVPVASASNSFWYAWVAPSNGRLTVSTEGTVPTLDTLVAVYIGTSLESLVSVGSDDDSGPDATSVLEADVISGTEYRIQITSYGVAVADAVCSVDITFIPELSFLRRYADLLEIHDYGSDVASPKQRIVATGFLNFVVFAQRNAPVLYWNGYGNAKLLPGLVEGERFDGVWTFQGFLLLWAGNRLKWSTQNDLTEWLSVGTTATSLVLRLKDPFTQAAAGVVIPDVATVAPPTGLVAGQFLRIDLDPYYSFFEVVSVLPSSGEDVRTVGISQTVAIGETKDIFLAGYAPYLAGGKVYFDSSPMAVMTVAADASALSTGSASVAEAFNAPEAGSSVTVSISGDTSIPAGGYVSVGASTYPGQDIYFVEGVNLLGGTMTLRRTGVGSSGSSFHDVGELIVPQMAIRVTNSSSVVATGAFRSTLKEQYAVSVKPMGLTGEAPAGTVFRAGTEIFTVDANGAGELTNITSSAQGEILHCDTLGDYGFVFKHRSIQSVQYVGADQGTFFLRTEISDEGLLGRYSFVKVGLDLMYFVGNREVYQYGGGNQLQPIGLPHTKQMFAELDRARADEIVGYHNERSSEVWFIYPVIGQTGCRRVFIYNYLEKSSTLDDYTEEIGGLTAANDIEWSNDIVWSRALGTWAAPESWVVDATWADLGSDVAPRYTFLGASAGRTPDDGPEILVGDGNQFSRKGLAYVSSWETADFDAGDPFLWKYVDTIVAALQVKATLAADPVPYINISLGTRPNYDAPITWSAPAALNVIGGANYVSKVNIRGSGRWFRLRVTSNIPEIQWRISHFRVLGRNGNVF